MTGTTFLQIFIIADIFFMGALAAVVAQHARKHFKPPKLEPEQPNLPAAEYHLPPALKERLLQISQDKFQSVLNQSADLLQYDLKATAAEINHMVNRLATEIVSGELERYRGDLSRLHNQAEVDISGIKKEIAGHQAEIKAKIAQELQAEKLQLIRQIDTKLADAVASFLLETLQHNIDLGSQSSYLLAMLEEHKADFTKEVANDAQSPR